MGLVDEEALLFRIKRAEAKAEDLFASLRDSLTVSSNRFQSQVDGLAAELGGRDGGVLSSALVGTIRITQVEPGFASAEELSALEAIVASNDDLIRASISESSKVASNETSALGRRFQHITARIDGDISAAATASALLEARVTVNEGDITSIASDVVTLQADFAAANVSGAASAISALDTRVTAVEGTVTSHSSDITTLQSDLTAAEGDITANGSAISALDTRVTSAEGTITSQSSSITTLQSDLTLAEGDIIANGSAVSSLDTRVTSAEGTITSHTSSINSLNSTVGSHTASISTNVSNIVAVQGDIASIEQEWGVSFDVNGRTTGRIRLDGTGETTTFDVLASAFRVSDASTALEVFSISGSKARFTSSVEIDGGLLINGTLTVGQVTDAASNTYVTNAVAPKADTTTVNTQLAGKISNGGAASDINANSTTISGGKITTGSIDANRLNVGTLSAITANLGTVTAGTISSSTQISYGSGSDSVLVNSGGLTVGSTGTNHIKIPTGTLASRLEVKYSSTVAGYWASYNVGGEHTSELQLKSSYGPQLDLNPNRLIFNNDTNLFRESANVLKTDDAFKSYSLTTTGGGILTEALTIDQNSGYAVQEMSGPSGSLIDLRPDSVGDYKLRLIADTGQASIQTAANYDLQLTPGGSGNVRFGTYVGSAQTITGYITIKDQNGTHRKLAVVA